MRAANLTSGFILKHLEQNLADGVLAPVFGDPDASGQVPRPSPGPKIRKKMKLTGCLGSAGRVLMRRGPADGVLAPVIDERLHEEHTDQLSLAQDREGPPFP